MRVKVESMRNKIDLKFEEVVEAINEMKREFLKKFDARWDHIFQGIEEAGRELESKLEKYESTLSEVIKIQSKVLKS